LPADLVLKVSVSLPVANPATGRSTGRFRVVAPRSSNTRAVAAIAAIRAAVAAPLDVYIEGADDFGAPVRHYDLPDIVRVAAPVYVKFAVRNAPNLYPSGGHLEAVAVATARERVRRAAIGLSMLKRYFPEATTR
jgi:hypothetical protein